MGRSCWRCKIGGDPPGGRRGGAVAGGRCRGEEKEDGLLMARVKIHEVYGVHSKNGLSTSDQISNAVI
jgi:hypothetical protein